jgi:hypothetical protein
MKILTKFQDILEISKECLEHKTRHSVPHILHSIQPLPPQINGPWEQSEEALKNTIDYVFNKLRYSCYLLCVTDSKPTLYKIVNRSTAPLFRSKINKTLKRQKTSKHKTWRVLQCVLKEHSKEEATSVEWERFLKELSIPLPDGVYLLNLTDAVLLRKDGKYPWDILENKPLDLTYSKFIPILGGSSQKGFHDIPMPNYDDIRVVMGYDKLPSFETDWNAKKPIAVFRGTPTGCGTTPETNMRLKLATMRSPELDVGIVSIPKSKLKYDPKKGFSMTQKVPTVPFMDMTEQSKHKYILHVDGNVAAYRLLKSMLTKSVILKVEGEYLLWIDHLLKPMKHYIPIKADLSDLQEKLEWCKKHDDKVRKIAENGYLFAKKVLTKDCIEETFAKLLWSV